MGDSAGRLFTGRGVLELFYPRACSKPLLPMGRGWIAGRHGSRMPAVLCTGIVEWTGSRVKGTAVRLDGPGGKSRRRCQGVLFLSRCHADEFMASCTL